MLSVRIMLPTIAIDPPSASTPALCDSIKRVLFVYQLHCRSPSHKMKCSLDCFRRRYCHNTLYTPSPNPRQNVACCTHLSIRSPQQISNRFISEEPSACLEGIPSNKGATSSIEPSDAASGEGVFYNSRRRYLGHSIVSTAA